MKFGLKFNPGLALTGVRTPGPWCLSFKDKGMGREGRVHVLYLRL